MIDISDPRIDAYLLKLVPEPPAEIVALEQHSQESGFPIVGRLTGRLLHLLTRLRNPQLVLEMGSGFGYSAFWFASALTGSGKVVLIDYSDGNIGRARQLFTATGLIDRAVFRTGDALSIGAEYSGIDILFIDLDKYQYLDALKLMLPRLGPHALVIADNSLWHGQVAEEGSPDADTQIIKDFNEFMYAQNDFFTCIVPLRDGVLVASKR